ncbi:MAG: hypothetical protein AVDCRST_MAG14-1483 [uncultured Rubrobacteraceae bacterium]|uniref:Uncharacterized protein n=1 Tax=uncultured Rubrobacteraceae bacterium TaxID=349277 RepID=A0A6J4QU43_9ACTN|nr:MAG: hypothetical protein AVDCRST_MAG14-1483 [uncultured Rubrobacteraceae bacterium]
MVPGLGVALSERVERLENSGDSLQQPLQLAGSTFTSAAVREER